EMHHSKHGHLVAEQLLVEQRPVAHDIARLFERAHAAQTRRRRDDDPVGELHIGDAAVVLQLSENLTVDSVETGRHGMLRKASSSGPSILTPSQLLTKHYCAKAAF